jgi:hypothetical protein
MGKYFVKYSIIRPQAHRSAKIGLYRWINPFLDHMLGSDPWWCPTPTFRHCFLAFDRQRQVEVDDEQLWRHLRLGFRVHDHVVGLRSPCATPCRCKTATPSMNWRHRDTTSSGRSPNCKTSSSGDFQGNTMIVFSMLTSMTSSNGMVWLDGSLSSATIDARWSQQLS